MVTENREIAIKAEGLKKRYKLGSIGGRTLQRELQSRWARRRGKEDPNARIMQKERLCGDEFWALNGIDLTIYRGERVGIIGNNGAGKSTLLKLFSRITAPTEGTIDIWGRISSMLEVGTGFHPEMTGRENIYMNGAILGMSKEEIDSKIDDIIAFSEIAEFIDTPVKRYSSGMFVKLAFSVAAHLTSEILVMDEVLAVGDMAFQQKCLDAMRRVSEAEGRTVLYVSHNMDTIRRLCDRCIVLNEGRIIFDGAVDEAIAVYMNCSLDENTVDIDLSGRKTKATGIITMEHLTLLDKACNDYTPEEKLRIRLTLDAKERLEHCYLRLTFRTDSDVGIGTAWSKGISFEKGRHSVDWALPLEQFAKGRFYISIGLYIKDEIGRDHAIEHITRAFRIEIEGVPTWDTRAHGYVSLPGIEMTEDKLI